MPKKPHQLPQDAASSPALERPSTSRIEPQEQARGRFGQTVNVSAAAAMRRRGKPPEFRHRVWFVLRSDGPRPPCLYWLPVARITAKMIFLERPWYGRSAIRRRELHKHLLYATPTGALLAFKAAADHWLAIARDDVAQAERELRFAAQPIATILHEAQEGV